MKRAGKEAGQGARPPACLSGAVALLHSASLEGPQGFGFRIFFSQLASAQAVTIFSQNLITPVAVKPKRSEI